VNRARRAGFQLRHIWEPAFTGCVLAEFAKKANEIAHEMSALAGGESRDDGRMDSYSRAAVISNIHGCKSLNALDQKMELHPWCETKCSRFEHLLTCNCLKIPSGQKCNPCLRNVLLLMSQDRTHENAGGEGGILLPPIRLDPDDYRTL